MSVPCRFTPAVDHGPWMFSGLCSLQISNNKVENSELTFSIHPSLVRCLARHKSWWSTECWLWNLQPLCCCLAQNIMPLKAAYGHERLMQVNPSCWEHTVEVISTLQTANQQQKRWRSQSERSVHIHHLCPVLRTTSHGAVLNASSEIFNLFIDVLHKI